MQGKQESLLVGYYTITPLHVGTGQATGAVDLPIAKEAHTGIPFIPSTSLKGAWRDLFKTQFSDKDEFESFFGNEIEQTREPGQSATTAHQAGKLIFNEAQLLLYPFRSLNTLYVYATCPLILERLQNNLKYFNSRQQLTLDRLDNQTIYVCNKSLLHDNLIVEDYICSEMEYYDHGEHLLEFLQNLVPDEYSTKRIEENLIILPDNIFIQLLETTLPVQARTKLTSAKTASKYNGESGNLWYEEYVPADTLFVSFIMDRPIITDEQSDSDLPKFKNRIKEQNISMLQIGGNETVGYGWTLLNIL